MPRKTLDLRFPAAGVIRRLGLEPEAGLRREAYPTPWAVNVRLEGSLASRMRGGSWTAIAAGDRPSEILYRDRLLTFSGKGITATRMGDHADTALSADVTDTMRPALFQLSEAGETGGDVVALIPHKDSFLLGFTANETWIQEGDPYTGPRRCVSREVGIIGADAWCVNHDTVYFLSSRGLYSVGADGSGLKPLSEDKLPEDLSDVDDDACTLTYNHADRGVYIHLTSGVSWFHDTARDGFWAFDSESTDSHVLLGPFRLGGPDDYGLIETLHGMTAAGSSDVTWRIVTGDTAEEAAANGKTAITAALAEEAFSQYVVASGTWEAGRSLTERPRVRAMWACLWLASTGDWAYEGMTMKTIPFGGYRK